MLLNASKCQVTALTVSELIREKLWFSDTSRGSRSGTLVENELILTIS